MAAIVSSTTTEKIVKVTDFAVQWFDPIMGSGSRKQCKKHLDIGWLNH